MKPKIIAISTILLSSYFAHSSVLQVANVTLGPGDTLFASSTNELLTDSIVEIGTFPVGFDVSANLGTSSWGNLVANFDILGSALTGTFSPTLGTSTAGYVESGNIDGPDYSVIGNTNSEFVGEFMYAFAGSATTLAESAATGEIALFEIRLILDDQPFEQTYRADPTGKNILIGDLGVFVGDPGGAGQGTYATLQLEAVPEPSALLLSAIGALGLLRRRR